MAEGRYPRILLLCLSLLSAACSRDTPTAQQQYTRTLRLLRTGDFLSSQKEAEAGEHLFRNDADVRCRFRLLRIEALLEGDKPREADALLAVSPEKTSPEYDVRALVLRSRRAVSRSDFDTATRLASESREAALRLNRWDLQAEADVQMGAILGRQRQYPQAEAVLQRGLADADRAGDSFRTASAKNNLGMLRMLRSRCDEALLLFQTAESIWRASNADHWAAIARANMGLCYSQLGDSDKALEYRRESVELWRPGARKANALGEMGTLHLTNEPGKAVVYYRQARDMASQFGALPDAARWAGNLTFALAAMGDWSGAETALAEALQLRPESRSKAFLDLSAADIALGRGRVEEAQSLYNKLIASSADNVSLSWVAHSGAAKAAIAAGDVKTAARHFEAAITIIESAWAELNANEYKITFLSSLIEFYQNYVDALMTQGQKKPCKSRIAVAPVFFRSGLPAK